MSKPGLIYRSEWTGADNATQVRVDIYKTTVQIDDAATETIINVQPGPNPLNHSTINNDRDKLKPVRAKQIYFDILTDDVLGIDISTFTGGPDSEFYVHAYVIGGDTIHKGYVQTAEISHSFLPAKQVMTLTATDCLGALKDIPLTDVDGAPLSGHARIIDFISWALLKTGLQLDIYVVNNLKHVDYPTDHFYDISFLDVKTFERIIQESENAYEALEKILKEFCFITQYKGAWWIVSVDEYDENDFYVTIFDYLGALVSNEPATAYNKSIGYNEVLKMAEGSQIIQMERPVSFARETYNFRMPLEIPCNSDFSTGSFVSALPDEVINSVTYTAKRYILQCWNLYENRPPTLSTHAEAYIKRLFNSDGYEYEKYVVITQASALIEQLLVSELFPVHFKDKFDYSFQTKYNGQVETGGGTITFQHGQIRLYGDDGTFWTLDGGLASAGAVPKWYQCTSSWNTNQKFFRKQWDGADDDTEWREFTFDNGSCPPIPVDGNLQIVFTHQKKVNQFELHISSLKFEYIPFINGTYQRYTGKYQKVTRSATGYLASRDEEIFMSDSPKKLFKGALKLFEGGAYVLARNLYAGNRYPAGPPGSPNEQPYSEHQVRAVYNQYVYTNTVITGSVMGLANGWPDLIHKYELTDIDPLINNRFFMLLTFDQNWKTLIMSGVCLTEVYNRTRGKTYSDPREHKYIAE